MSGFKFRPAAREETPLLIGLVGASGSGKTKSALRLAEGIISVRGGQIVGIDTEAKRMLHYADKHTFQYLQFDPDHSSLRYMEALVAAAEEASGGCVIVDSMSHEHEGEGGYLEFAEAEVVRMKCKDTAPSKWIRPASNRRKLITKLLKLECAFVFCFRAKQKIKPVAGKEPIQLGWQPIAGPDFSFEMTARCLLLPGSKGVPDWSHEAFAHEAAKLPEDFESILTPGRRLDEQCGAEMAQWAKGEVKPELISPEELMDMKIEIVSCQSVELLKEAFRGMYTKAKRSNDEFAMSQLKAEYDKRNLQLM